jgi:hypothetical protein
MGVRRSLLKMNYSVFSAGESKIRFGRRSIALETMSIHTFHANRRPTCSISHMIAVVIN